MAFLRPQYRAYTGNQASQFQQQKETRGQKSSLNYQKKIEDYIYSMHDAIGTGQFSTVFSGYHISTGEKVAIKVVEVQKITQPIFLTLIQNEVAILKTLAHKNLLQLKGVFSTANNIYIITEFCNQGDLNEIIKTDKIIPEYRAIKIMKHLVHGLINLEKNQIIHRDIKPANILVSAGIPKLADFGFAISKQLSLNQKQTFEGLSVGTPLYMAPETLIYNQYNTKTDLWALGCVFYEMLFGQVPFLCVQHQDLLDRIQKYKIENKLQFPLNQVSKESINLIKSLLAYDPAKRISLQEIVSHPVFNGVSTLKVTSLKRQVTSVLIPSPFGKEKNMQGDKFVKKFDFEFEKISGEKQPNPVQKKVGRVNPKFYFSDHQETLPSQCSISTNFKSELEIPLSPEYPKKQDISGGSSYSKITRKNIKINTKTLLFDTNATYLCLYFDQVMQKVIKESFFNEIEWCVQRNVNEKMEDLEQIRSLKVKLRYLSAKAQLIFYTQYGVVQQTMDKYSNQLLGIILSKDIIQDRLFAQICNDDYSPQLSFFKTHLQYLKLFIKCIEKYLVKQIPLHDNLLPQNIQESVVLLDYVVITYQLLQLFIQDVQNFGQFCKKSQIERFIELKPETNITIRHFVDIKKKIQNLNLN